MWTGLAPWLSFQFILTSSVVGTCVQVPIEEEQWGPRTELESCSGALRTAITKRSQAVWGPVLILVSLDMIQVRIKAERASLFGGVQGKRIWAKIVCPNLTGGNYGAVAVVCTSKVIKGQKVNMRGSVKLHAVQKQSVHWNTPEKTESEIRKRTSTHNHLREKEERGEHVSCSGIYSFQRFQPHTSTLLSSNHP